MSIKRTKQRSFSSKDGDAADNTFGGNKVAPAKIWADEVAGKDDASFTAYTPAGRFAKGALMSHSKFGKGLVLSVEGARIEVLFEDGPKKLGHAG